MIPYGVPAVWLLWSSRTANTQAVLTASVRSCLDVAKALSQMGATSIMLATDEAKQADRVSWKWSRPKRSRFAPCGCVHAYPVSSHLPAFPCTCATERKSTLSA